MLEFLLVRYTQFLPELLAQGLPFQGCLDWLGGTTMGAIVVLIMTWALSLLQKKDAAGKIVANWVGRLISVLWAAVVLDALAPVLVPMGVAYGFFLGAYALWQNRQRAPRPTPSARPS